jgi:hypothetical protein
MFTHTHRHSIKSLKEEKCPFRQLIKEREEKKGNAVICNNMEDIMLSEISTSQKEK